MLIVTAGCAPTEPNSPSASEPNPTSAEPARQLEGMELYSWREGESDHCRFALLPGTNRRKSAAQIIDVRTQLHDFGELQRALAELPDGEIVFWQLPREAGEVPPEVSFAFPPDDLVQSLRRQAEASGLRLQVLPDGSEQGQR